MIRLRILLISSIVFSSILYGCVALAPQLTPTPTVTEMPNTETPRPTETPTFTPSPTSTSTITPLPPFVPEGFTVGELGLLRNPETQQNALRLNQEADWAAFRQLIVENLWQANRDWASFFGLSSDATRLSKEEFLKKALAGEMLTFGIPIRADSKDLTIICPPQGCRPYKGRPGEKTYSGYPSDIQLHVVQARLDGIRIQVVDSAAFIQYMEGRGWTASDQQAYSLGNPDHVQSIKEASCNAIHFAEENGFLIITLGSYYSDDVPNISQTLLIGRFDTSLHGKYPSYYRGDGLGVQADHASSVLLGSAIEHLQYFQDVRWRNGYGQLVHMKRSDGTFIDALSSQAIQRDHFDESWLNWNLFLFSQ